MLPISPKPLRSPLVHMTELERIALEEANAAAAATAQAAHDVAVAADVAAANAKSAADTAATKADTASSKANTADTKAGTATTTASDAKTTADTAVKMIDSADILTLSAQGTATFTFAVAYTTKPILRNMVFDPSGTNTAILVQAESWVMVKDKFAGVNIRAYRAQKMGTQQPVTLTSLLGGVITGLNNLITMVSGFNPFGGTSFTGVEVHITARYRTPTST